MSFASNFAPFSENSNNFEIFSRTFEELVSERGEQSNINNIKTDYYSQLFEKINSKIRNIEPDVHINVVDCDIVKDHIDKINELKKNVCNVYLEYIDVDTRLNEAKTKYLHFSDTIKDCIQCIIQNDIVDESDETIKTLLENKVDELYNRLKIEDLLEEYTKKYEEFEKTKYKISIMTGVILPTTTCQICMENQVDYFIDPCGHTICRICKAACENKSDKCHYCRTTRKMYKRIYL